MAVDDGARHAEGRVLIPGTGSGRVLALTRPLSFWGGVDPATGRIIDPRHPQYGESVAGTVLLMERAVGSSSSSAVMLELIRNGVAPRAVVMGATDAILALGVLVARELGYETLPMLECPSLDYRAHGLNGAPASVERGSFRWHPESDS